MFLNLCKRQRVELSHYSVHWGLRVDVHFVPSPLAYHKIYRQMLWQLRHVVQGVTQRWFLELQRLHTLVEDPEVEILFSFWLLV